jgi:hypothetical protein
MNATSNSTPPHVTTSHDSNSGIIPQYQHNHGGGHNLSPDLPLPISIDSSPEAKRTKSLDLSLLHGSGGKEQHQQRRRLLSLFQKSSLSASVNPTGNDLLGLDDGNTSHYRHNSHGNIGIAGNDQSGNISDGGGVYGGNTDGSQQADNLAASLLRASSSGNNKPRRKSWLGKFTSNNS